MKYYDGYKVVIAQTFSVKTNIYGFEIKERLSGLTKEGLLTVERFYASDLNSGPCWDFKSTKKAAVVHDVLCDYINMRYLPRNLQPLVDQEYYNICVAKGAWELLARLRLIMVRWYQTGKAKRFNRKMLTA